MASDDGMSNNTNATNATNATAFLNALIVNATDDIVAAGIDIIENERI